MSTIANDLMERIAVAQGPVELSRLREEGLLSAMTPEERGNVDEAVAKRFCELNSQAAGEQKPRW